MESTPQEYDLRLDNDPNLHQINYAPSSTGEPQHPYDLDWYNLHVHIPRPTLDDGTNLCFMNTAQGHVDLHMPIAACRPSKLASSHHLHVDKYEPQGPSTSWSSPNYPELDPYPPLPKANPASTLFNPKDFPHSMAFGQSQPEDWHTWTTEASPALASFSNVPDDSPTAPSSSSSQAGPSAPLPVTNRYRKPPKANSDDWTQEEDNYLLMLKKRKTPHQEISAELLDKFGVDRNPNVVGKRLRKLYDNAVDTEVCTYLVIYFLISSNNGIFAIFATKPFTNLQSSTLLQEGLFMTPDAWLASSPLPIRSFRVPKGEGIRPVVSCLCMRAEVRSSTQME